MTDTLSAREVSFDGWIVNDRRQPLLRDILQTFSADFVFGRAYLIDAAPGRGGWALSWMIAGLLEPTRGEILLDNQPFTRLERRRRAWAVRHAEITGLLHRPLTVKNQVARGLKSKRSPLPTHDEVINAFMLTPQRYIRLMRQLSHEAWNASPAVGLANGRHIFCYYNLSFWRPEPRVVDELRLRLERAIAVLKQHGCLVILPVQATPTLAEIVDEVITLP